MKRLVSFTATFALLFGLFGPGLAAATSSRTTPSARSASAYRFFQQHGYMVGDQARYAAYKQVLAARAARMHLGAATPASPAALSAAAPSFEGTFDTAGDPPDTTGAVGPKSYVEAVNSKVAIFSKTGTLISANTFDAALGPCQTTAAVCEYSDPQVIWDIATARFYYLDLNADIGGTDNYFVWGFSKTSNPQSFTSADWCNYQADFGYGANLPDYPKMGQTTDFLMIGANIYALEAYAGSDIDTIAKPQGSEPVTSCPAQNTFDLNKTASIADCKPQGVFASDPNPAVEAGNAGTGWVAAVPDPTNSGFSANWIDIIKVTKDKTTGKPVVHPAQCVSVPQYGPPPPATQKPAPPIPPYTIDTLDGRIEHAVIAIDPRLSSPHHNGRALWTDHTVVDPTNGFSEVDWYEIDVSHATTFQTGVVSDPNLYVYNGNISDDRNDPIHQYGSDMVLGFSTSGPNAFPAVQMVSKVAGGPQSAFGLIKSSPGPDASFSCSQNPIVPGKCRWGDYSGAVPDAWAPRDMPTGRVWLDNQWVDGTDGSLTGPTWRTWIWRATPA